MKFLTTLLAILISTSSLFAQSKITQAKGVSLGSTKQEVLELLKSRGEQPQNGYGGNMMYTLKGDFGGNQLKDTKYFFDNFNRLYEIAFLFSTENLREVKALHKEITQNLNKKYGQPYATDSISTKKVKLGELYSSTMYWRDSNEKLKGGQIYLKKNKLTRKKGTETHYIYLSYKDVELEANYNLYLKQDVDEDY